MIRLAAVIFSLILCPNGSLADTDCLENEDLALNCGAYCFSAMKPVLGYVKANQQQLDTCAKGSMPDFSQINKQLSEIQNTLGSGEEGETLLQRLDKIEKKLEVVLKEKDSLQNQLNSIQNALIIKARIAKHGDKMYIVDDRSSTNPCEKEGGKLASIEWIDGPVNFRSGNIKIPNLSGLIVKKKNDLNSLCGVSFKI